MAGTVTYKGRTYYLAGRTARGRTHYDDRVETVSTKDGGKVLLYFRDGSSQFWADRAAVTVIKTYSKPQTISGLARYAEKVKQAGSADDYHAERAEKSGRCRGCGGAIRDARHHAAMDGYCGSCAFDEFDC